MKSNKSKISYNRGFTKDVILNLFQVLHRFKSESKETALNKGSFRAPLRFGFTLIELLVVVLIIGILAAVAVPQYRFAVEKSRVSRILPIVKSIREAEQLYYLNNGRYTPVLEKLDFTIVGNAGSGGMIHDDFHLNMNNDRFSLSYCPQSLIKNGSTNCLTNRWFYYTEYFDNSTPRSCDIYKNSNLSSKLCQFLLDS